MNSGYSEPPDIVNFLPGPFEFTIMRVHCMLIEIAVVYMKSTLSTKSFVHILL